MSKRLLIIAESIDVNDSSGTKGRVALIKNLAKAGYTLTVLHYTRRPAKIEGIKTIPIQERKWHILYLLAKIQTYLYRWFKLDIGMTLQHWFGQSFTFFNDSKSIANALKAYSPNAFDMVWSFSKGDSYRTHNGVLQSKSWHSKWYAYVHDPYPANVYPKPFNYNTSGYKQKQKFFNAMCVVAKHVVFPSQLLSKWMMKFYPSIKQKIVIIPHQITSMQEVSQSLPSYFNTTQFNIVLAGNLIGVRNPKPLIKAFKLFLTKNPEALPCATCFIIGKTTGYKTYLDNEAKTTPQLKIHHGYQDFNTVYNIQQAACINVILEADAEISPFLPGKFPHCVASNSAILHIGPKQSEVNRLLNKTNSNSFEHNAIENIAQWIAQTFKIWQSNPNAIKHNAKELKSYLGVNYLQEVLTSQ